MVRLAARTPDETVMDALRREPAVELRLPRAAAWSLAQGLVNGMTAWIAQAPNDEHRQNAERVMDIQISRLLDVVMENQAGGVKGPVVWRWNAAQVWVALLLVEAGREAQPNTPAARVMEAMACFLLVRLPRWARLKFVKSCNLTAGTLRVAAMADPVACLPPGGRVF